MTLKIFISTLLVLTLTSCNSNRAQDNTKQETPSALDDKSSSYELTSKRSYGDMVESLYAELVSNNIELKQLEDKIDDLNSSRADSTNSFDKFNEKNLAYFRSTDRLISEIKDTSLSAKMKVLIADNLTKYNSSIAKHNELRQVIDAKNLKISDLHNMLKIVKTLPLIEKYQREHLPNTKSLEGFIIRQEEAVKLADTLVKR